MGLRTTSTAWVSSFLLSHFAGRVIERKECLNCLSQPRGQAQFRSTRPWRKAFTFCKHVGFAPIKWKVVFLLVAHGAMP